MTTEQTMSGNTTRRRTARSLRVGLLGGALGALAAGCESGPKDPPLVKPATTVSPYLTTQGVRVWAVAPLINESGTTLADALGVSDKLVAALQEVRGISCLPLNRTLEYLSAAEMQGVSTPADAAQLAEALGVDGVIVGTITAYNPYDPPTLGLSLVLYQRSGTRASTLDVRRLAESPTAPATSSYRTAPSASVSLHLDGRNHEVLAAVQEYALGRTDERFPLGWRRYLASMDLFTQFATHHAVDRLLAGERERMGPRVVRARDD